MVKFFMTLSSDDIQNQTLLAYSTAKRNDKMFDEITFSNQWPLL